MKSIGAQAAELARHKKSIIDSTGIMEGRLRFVESAGYKALAKELREVTGLSRASGETRAFETHNKEGEMSKSTRQKTGEPLKPGKHFEGATAKFMNDVAKRRRKKELEKASRKKNRV